MKKLLLALFLLFSIPALSQINVRVDSARYVDMDTSYIIPIKEKYSITVNDKTVSLYRTENGENPYEFARALYTDFAAYNTAENAQAYETCATDASDGVSHLDFVMISSGETTFVLIVADQIGSVVYYGTIINPDWVPDSTEKFFKYFKNYRNLNSPKAEIPVFEDYHKRK